MCYAHDFPDAWPRCDLIVVASSSVPIKKGVIETISAATPVGKGKDKNVKQKAVKKSEIEESAEGTDAGQGTKRRKTTKARKQLVISEGLEGADPSAIGKEISHPPIPKTKVKTKVESSIL